MYFRSGSAHRPHQPDQPGDQGRRRGEARRRREGRTPAEDHLVFQRPVPRHRREGEDRQRGLPHAVHPQQDEEGRHREVHGDCGQ